MSFRAEAEGRSRGILAVPFEGPASLPREQGFLICPRSVGSRPLMGTRLTLARNDALTVRLLFAFIALGWWATGDARAQVPASPRNAPAETTWVREHDVAVPMRDG